MAGGLFVLPGVIAIMALSYIYAAYGNVGFVEALFFGLKAAVLAIVLEAVVRVGRRALQNRVMIAHRGGRLRRDLLLRRAVPAHHPRGRPDRLSRRPSRPAGIRRRSGTAAAARRPRSTACSARNCPTTSARACRARCKSARIWLLLWLVPVAALLIALGQANVFSQIALFFTQDGGGDLRRRLCGAGLCRAAGGRALSLAAAAARCSTASAWPRPRRAR